MSKQRKKAPRAPGKSFQDLLAEMDGPFDDYLKIDKSAWLGDEDWKDYRGKDDFEAVIKKRAPKGFDFKKAKEQFEKAKAEREKKEAERKKAAEKAKEDKEKEGGEEKP